MLVPKALPDASQRNSSSQKPADQISWLFGGLSAAELLPKLQQYLLAQDATANWQLVWLNNDGRPVIGLLPKVGWSVYPTNNRESDKPLPYYKVVKNLRNNGNAIMTTNMSYMEWQDELINYSQAYENDHSTAKPTNKKNDHSSYHHGLMGFIGYDMVACELSPAANIKLAAQPCAVLGHYDIYLTAIDTDTELSSWSLNVIKTKQTGDNEPNEKTLNLLISYLNKLDAQLSGKDKPTATLAPLTLRARWHKEDYQCAFEKTQHYLQQGDCYQINLTQAWQNQFTYKKDHEAVAALIDYLPALQYSTQAPFAGYMNIQALGGSFDKNSTFSKYGEHSSFELLSCSPELFFTFVRDSGTGKHHIRTKPIKGTRPRGNSTEQDLILEQELATSNKDRAENVMIVDLLRNDLGRYAKTGSVKVPHLFSIESFSNVHHMVSTITAELAKDAHPLAVLFGSLPAGSITGTPKKRAVEIISELEVAPRGAYCGTMGYMNFDGSGQWNVLIRTLQAQHLVDESSKTTKVSLWAGGGITIASKCSDEYQESLDKVSNLLTILETI